MKPFQYLTNCIDSDGESINNMKADATAIKYRTFVRNCECSVLFLNLGYRRDFPIAKDWHVGYFKSKYQGQPCYYLTWSGIEYIFVEPN